MTITNTEPRAEHMKRDSTLKLRSDGRKPKRSMHGLASGLSLLGIAALLGCAASEASSPVPATAVSSLTVDDGLAADLMDRHRFHSQGGVTMFIALSLDTLGLPPERQAAVTKIQSDLFTALEPSRLDQQSVLNALADGVAAGAVDKARVDAAVAKLASSSGQAHEASADALNRLHAALTPPERAALVDKVWAHWSVFRQADEDAQGGKDRQSRRLTELAKDIGLSADQVAKIGKTLQDTLQVEPVALDPSEVEAHLKRLGAFREESFDTRALADGATANAHLAARGASRTAHFYEVVSPVLTPEQRTKVVLLLREHAGHQDLAAVAAPAH
jgi:Spy/CpxP family protein refolding chaperone